MLVYSELNKRGEGPFIVVDCTGRQVTKANKEVISHQIFSTFEIKSYFRDYQAGLQYFSSKSTNEESLYTVHITEVIELQDPRSKLFDEPIKKEIHQKSYAEVRFQKMVTY